MDWSRAKTIFIFTFLLLNIFLGIQLNEIRVANNLNLLAEATLQERLSEENITITVELQEDPLIGTYISGFADFPLKETIKTELKSHKVVESEDDFLVVSIEEPLSLDLANSTVEAASANFLEEHIINGSEYLFSHYDRELNQIYFYQTFDGKKVEYYESGRFPLMLQLDDQNNIVLYEQSYLMIQPILPQGKEQEILTSIRAIEKLFNKQLIPADSEIHKVELSYYSFFKPLGEIQVFAPMWNIGVNDNIYYVNAIDGAVQNIQ